MIIRPRLIFLLVILGTFACALVATARGSGETPLITLKEGNFAAINREVTSGLLEDASGKIDLADPNKPFYLFVDTNGGDGFATMHFMEKIKVLNNVTCISLKAISAGFMITQACQNRDVLINSVFMWHSTQSSISGSTEDIRHQVDVMQKIQDVLDKFIADRLKISVTTLEKRKSPEYWTIGGQNIIDSNQGDELITVKCSPELAGKTEDVAVGETPFGPVVEKHRVCPL